MKRSIETRLYRPLYVGILFFILTIVIYVNSLNNMFIFDDYLLIVHNKAVKTFELKKILFNSHRPVRTLVNAALYKFFELNPAGYRIFNMFFHVINSLLCFLLIRFLTRRFWLALSVSLLFGFVKYRNISAVK